MRIFSMIMICLLASFCSSGQESLVVTLPAADTSIDCSFYVAGVEDVRNNKDNGYAIRKGKRIPVTFNKTATEAFQNFFASLLPSSSQEKLPVIVRIRKLNLTERNSGSTRIAKTEMTLEFLRKDPDTLFQLLELNTWMEQGESGDDTGPMQVKNITGISKKMAMQFAEVMKENANDPLFASSILFKVRSSAGPYIESDTLFWNADRPLTWSDFKGREGSGEFAAQSNCAFAQDIHPEFENNRGIIYITVRAAFLRLGSWVKKGQESSAILKHEQLHFDIAELHVRKLRKKIAEAELTLGNYEAIVTGLYNQAWDEYNQMQAEYDVETRHGTIDSEQIKWNSKIEEGLHSFAAFR